MITVVIYINERPILARSARNTGHTNEANETEYHCDTGAIILHKREDGAVELAKKLLNTVKEP